MESDYSEIQEEIAMVQNDMSLLHVSPIGSDYFYFLPIVEISYELSNFRMPLNKWTAPMDLKSKINRNFNLGSIVAWVTKPDKEAEQESLSLPDGWVECDGG